MTQQGKDPSGVAGSDRAQIERLRSECQRLLACCVQVVLSLDEVLRQGDDPQRRPDRGRPSVEPRRYEQNMEPMTYRKLAVAASRILAQRRMLQVKVQELHRELADAHARLRAQEDRTAADREELRARREQPPPLCRACSGEVDVWPWSRL